MIESDRSKIRLIKVDGGRCTGCFECIDVCPQSKDTEFPVFTRSDEGVPRIANADNCIMCLSCEMACRAVALEVEVAGRRRPASLKQYY